MPGKHVNGEGMNGRVESRGIELTTTTLNRKKICQNEKNKWIKVWMN